MNALLAIQTAVAEAVDPKRVMRAMRPKPKIWPGNHYYLNVTANNEPWAEGEFCPVSVTHEGYCVLNDGMYGLEEDIMRAINYREGNANSEASLDKWARHYEGTMLDQVHKGITSGTISGIVGMRHWRLVYDPREDRTIWTWTPGAMVQVKPGQEYGPPLQQEAVDPKRILKKLSMGEFIKIRVYGNVMRQDGIARTTVGWLEVNGLGHTRNVDVTGIQGFNQEWVERIVRDLRRGKLGGNFGRTIHYWWATEDRGGVDRITDVNVPVLTVTTPEWTIQMPLINDVRWQTLGWKAQGLTPDQKRFMEEHGETIWYAMNEGDDFEDDIRNYPEPDADEVVVGHWSVSGDPDKAPEFEGEWSYG